MLSGSRQFGGSLPVTSNASPATDSLLARLENEARAVLDASWLGASTLPSRTLYPHQWNWDSAFIAIGRSWYDEARAQQELRSLFARPVGERQGAEHRVQPVGRRGRLLPGPGVLADVETRRADAPRDVETSGITQPAIHARAALEMHRHAHDVEASRAFLRWLYPRLVAEHAYMTDRRGPDRHRSAGRRASLGVRPGQLTGLGPRPRRDGDPAGCRAAVRPARPRPRRSQGSADERGLRPVRLPRRPLPGLRAMTTRGSRRPCPSSSPVRCSTRSTLWSTHALAEIATIVGADPRAASGGSRSGSTRRCSPSCGIRRRGSSAHST